jgi:ribosomal protein S18 acetylase RimI-like enzyme
LGKDVYCLKNPFVDIFKNDFPASPSLVYIKISTSSVEEIKRVENLGFNLVDTNILLCWKNKIGFVKSSIPHHYSTRLSRPTDRDQLGSIAQHNFRFSRFHLDPKVSKIKADRVKKAWVQNFFEGDRGDYMIVSCFKDQPVGFTQIVIKSDSELIIDLICVDSQHHGVGLASAMISFLINKIAPSLPDIKDVLVGTQISNLPSLSLYQKLGFKIISSDYVFHYHS